MDGRQGLTAVVGKSTRRLRLTIRGAAIPALLVLGAACSPSQAVSETQVEAESRSGLSSGPLGLAERPGPRRETTGDVPHIQIDAVPNETVDDELRRRVFMLPGVEERESARSLPGAAGLWLDESLELERQEVLGGGREMAHIHPDGSLHVFLPVDLALEVESAKWGELHPWVTREGFWEGVTMVYTPETVEEVDVVMAVLVASYNFIVGADIDAADFS